MLTAPFAFLEFLLGPFISSGYAIYLHRLLFLPLSLFLSFLTTIIINDFKSLFYVAESVWCLLPLNASFYFSIRCLSSAESCAQRECLRIFDSINLNLMTFVLNQTHTVTKSGHYPAKIVPFFFQQSLCYHFIIRPKNNKNKSLMLCFTLLSIEYWFCVPLNWYFLCGGCSLLTHRCASVCDALMWIKTTKWTSKNCKEKRRRWKKKSTCWTF